MPKQMWIHKDHTDLPRNQLAGVEYIEISIPDRCPHCNHLLEIQAHQPGSASEPSYLVKSCDHTRVFNQLWEIRLPSETLNNIKIGIDYASIYSCHRCKMINEYATPNQKDGTYICYNCR